MRKKQQNKTNIAKNKTSFYLRIRQIRANLRQKEKVTKPQLALFIYLTWLTTIPAWDKRIFMEMRHTSGNRIRASARGHTQTITCQFFFSLVELEILPICLPLPSLLLAQCDRNLPIANYERNFHLGLALVSVHFQFTQKPSDIQVKWALNKSNLLTQSTVGLMSIEQSHIELPHLWPKQLCAFFTSRDLPLSSENARVNGFLMAPLNGHLSVDKDVCGWKWIDVMCRLRGGGPFLATFRQNVPIYISNTIAIVSRPMAEWVSY